MCILIYIYFGPKWTFKLNFKTLIIIGLYGILRCKLLSFDADAHKDVEGVLDLLIADWLKGSSSAIKSNLIKTCTWVTLFAAVSCADTFL